MKQDMRKHKINVALTQSSNMTAYGSKHTKWSGRKSIQKIKKNMPDHIIVPVCTLCKSPVNALAKRVGMMMISEL